MSKEWPENLKTGDHVRVVLEGPVTCVYSSTTFDIAGTNEIDCHDEHLKSVEVLAPPVKVGDIISGAQANKLPAESVIVYVGCDNGGTSLKRRDGTWVNAGYEIDEYPESSQYRVLHLPEVAA